MSFSKSTEVHGMVDGFESAPLYAKQHVPAKYGSNSAFSVSWAHIHQ